MSAKHAHRPRQLKTQIRREIHKGYEVLEPRQLLAGDVCFVTDSLWSAVPESFTRSVGDQTHVQATQLELFDLDERPILDLLDQAPLEVPGELTANPVTLSIPNPDGVFERFAIVESPIFEPELAEQFANIKTYRGQGIDNPSSTIRLDYTDHGFHAQVLAEDNGDYYIDPFIHRQTDVYASYFVHDALAQPNNEYVELGIDTEHLPDYSMDAEAILSAAEHHELVSHDDGPCTCPLCTAAREIKSQGGSDANADAVSKTDGSGGSRIAPDFGEELRTYRLAVAATGEYTQFHGGSVSDGMSAIVTTMNRVNGLYENDLAIRMVIVAGNDELIYTNGATDPYTNNDGVAMLGENQANVDSIIGNANYDIGHVFSTGGGGIAGLGVVGVTGAKARGVTGLPSPTGDSFDVDFVAHEIGHQFDGNHTFNGDSGSCAGANRNGSTAFEPGSGTSIQAYAGICGNDNLQPNSDSMFHSLSIDEIRAYVTTGVGNSSAVITSTGNSIPTVDAGGSFTIPAGTPFELTAVGSDPDGGDQLTYSWEQRDLGPQQDVNGGDNGSSPIFRAFDPTVDSTRTFPRIGDLLNNTTTIGETLPTTDRTLNFRVVLRDNASGGGGVVSDDTTVNVNPTGEAFVVTSQNSAASWLGDSQQTITWNVAGTDANGIDTANVDILLAADGVNYNMVLASAVPNDGSQEITVPNIDTTTARIKVKGSGNIFFDINNTNIEIQRTGAGVLLTQSGGRTEVSESGVTDSYELLLGSVPAGAVTISATADDQTELSLDGTNYSTSISFSLANTTPEEIFVRAIDDTVEEGLHSSTISHEITSTDDPNDYPTSTLIGDVIVSVADNDSIEPLIVGVDFDIAAGNGPSNWLTIGTGSNATFSNLGSESGLATPFDLTITEAGGGWTEFAATPNAATIPQHGVSLANVGGQIFTTGDAIELVWSDLNPLLEYEIYVFGLEGFFDTIEQNVTVTGDDSTSFEQRFNQNDLFINDQLGDSNRSLSDYALIVGADDNGEIRIQVDPIAGTDDVVLGGVAITELPNEAPTEILLSNNEIAENTDTSAGPVEIGLLSAVDSDSDSFTYSLVSGDGDEDNALFEVVGDSLQIQQGTLIDFENAPSYSVRVEVSDGINTYQESLTILVIDQAESSNFIVGDGTSQRSMLQSLEIEFDGIVTLGATPFELLKRGTGGGVVDVTSTIDNSSGSSVVTLTFSGSFVESSGSLEDGNYQLTVFGDQIQTTSGLAFDADGDGIAGGNFVFGDTATDNFYRFYGDVDGNRRVDIFDLLSFRQTYLTQEGDENFNENLDSNNDGVINIFDLLPFRQNYLVSLDFE